MKFSYDVITGYAIIHSGPDRSIVGYFQSLEEAKAAARDGDHIHFICGSRSDSREDAGAN